MVKSFKLGISASQYSTGHTPESTTYLLKDEVGKDHAIFTGDTLFIGDVGRPDLAAKSDLTIQDLAGMLYDSLQQKILPLADEVIVYPGHGAGSACGKNISKETVSTVGVQRQMNYALQPMSKEQFIEVVTDGLETPPAYFPENVKLNKGGYEDISLILERNQKALSVSEFEVAAKDALILDTRTPDEYEQGHVPNSINIGLNGQFAPWVGALISISQPLVLVASEDKVYESVLRLARVGFTQVKGYLAGGVAAWEAAEKPVRKVASITAEEIKQFPDQEIIDVRRSTEYATDHIVGAKSLSLVELEERLDELDPAKPYIIHCAGGYRSMIAASMMKNKGFDHVTNVYGGFAAIKKVAGITTESGACPNQLKREALLAKK